jgi:hypothetical protein
MNLYGKLERIHENGVISYDMDTRSDLARYSDVCEYKLAVAIEEGEAEEIITRLEDEFIEFEKKRDKFSEDDMSSPPHPPSFSRITPEALHCDIRAPSLGFHSLSNV